MPANARQRTQLRTHTHTLSRFSVFVFAIGHKRAQREEEREDKDEDEDDEKNNKNTAKYCHSICLLSYILGCDFKIARKQKFNAKVQQHAYFVIVNGIVMFCSVQMGQFFR